MNFKDYITESKDENLDEARMSFYKRKDLKSVASEVNKALQVLTIALSDPKKSDLPDKISKAQYKKLKKVQTELLDWTLSLDDIPMKDE